MKKTGLFAALANLLVPGMSNDPASLPFLGSYWYTPISDRIAHARAKAATQKGRRHAIHMAGVGGPSRKVRRRMERLGDLSSSTLDRHSRTLLSDQIVGSRRDPERYTHLYCADAFA